MQRLPTRFAWNDLSIRAKIGVILVLILVLAGLTALITSVFIGGVGRQTREGVATAVEIRTLSQDVELKVERLQRIHTDLSGKYSVFGFDPNTDPLRDQYAEVYLELTEQDLPRLRELLFAAVSGEQRNALEREFRTTEESLISANDDFEQMYGVIFSLTDPTTGTIPRLRQQGNALEADIQNLGFAQLTSQMAVIRGLEESLIQTGSNQVRQDVSGQLTQFRILYGNTVPLTNQSVLGSIAAYLATVDETGTLLLRLEIENINGTNNLDSSSEAASRLSNIANELADAQVSAIEALTLSANRPLLIGALVQLLALAALMFFFGRTMLVSLNRLLSTTRRFEEGNFNARVEIVGEDEFNQLGRSFNNMAGQLADLVGGLEERVAERTRDLSITAEIGQAVLATRDPRELMQEVVDLIRDRFDFYHVQVFVVNDEGSYARLVASTGVVGRELLARRHQLAIGSQSIIGQVTANGTPQIALDTDTSGVHRRNELLPDTRSEMALPMRIGERVIGALDVQSVAPNAFDQDTVAVFQIMADQLAIALENARVRRDLEVAMEELGAMERRITSEAWRTYKQTRDPNAPLGFEMQGEVLLPQRGSIPTPVQNAMEHGRLIAQENGENDIQIALPIKVRGEVIGAFGFGGGSVDNLSEDDIALVEAVIDRVGLALENMRLVEQTARRAEYEQIVNEITAKIVGSTDVNYILQTTVRELGKALRAPQTSVQLRRESQELVADD